MKKEALTYLLVLVSLVLLPVAATADCTKDDIIKLINAGYTKAEIASLCGSRQETPAQAPAAPGDRWTDPVSGIEFVFVRGGMF